MQSLNRISMQMIQLCWNVSSLRMWFEKLCRLGPSYGYYPEPKMTVIVVDKKDEESGNACFHNSGIKVINGCHFLGGFIGSKELTKQFIEDKIDAWLVCVDKLARAGCRTITSSCVCCNGKISAV